MRRLVADRWRVLRLTAYYLAIIVGLLLVHLTPDRGTTPFVYQAF
jgi:hypothetical protein